MLLSLLLSELSACHRIVMCAWLCVSICMSVSLYGVSGCNCGCSCCCNVSSCVPSWPSLKQGRESALEEFQELSEVQLLFCIMPAQARDRSRSRDRSWHVGDQFAIVGPPWSRWYPGKRGGWQPKFWWGHPDDPTSTPVLPTELFIDTSATFTITDIHIQNSGPRFLAVQIQVDGYHVWTSVSREGVPWARRSR